MPGYTVPALVTVYVMAATAEEAEAKARQVLRKRAEVLTIETETPKEEQ